MHLCASGAAHHAARAHKCLPRIGAHAFLLHAQRKTHRRAGPDKHTAQALTAWTTWRWRLPHGHRTALAAGENITDGEHKNAQYTRGGGGGDSRWTARAGRESWPTVVHHPLVHLAAKPRTACPAGAGCGWQRTRTSLPVGLEQHRAPTQQYTQKDQPVPTAFTTTIACRHARACTHTHTHTHTRQHIRRGGRGRAARG
jgi:hypothetical protein